MRALVTGRVLRRADELLIQADVIDVANDRQLWGHQYERPMSALVAIEKYIAREISEHLPLKISQETPRPVPQPGPTTPAAPSPR